MPGIDHLIRTDFKAVDKTDPLRSVMGWLTGNGGKTPIVTDGGRVVGIMNERSLMKRRLDMRTKLDHHMTATRALPEAANVADVMRRMMEYRAPYLPVQDEQGHARGYITALDIAREDMTGLPASETCVKVTQLHEDQTLGEALHAFADEYVDVLPVVDAGGHIRGVLHRRAIVMIGAGTGRTPGRMDAGGESGDPLSGTVGGFMAPATQPVPPGTTHGNLLDLVSKNGYALVHDGHKRFLGLVTPATLFENRSH